MNKFYIFFLSVFLIQFSISVLDVGDVYYLPDPEKEGGMPLNEALNKRKTSRDFDPSIKLTPQIISQALWSCYGENRPKGYKTTPSAVAWYPLQIYLFLEEGVFTYEPSNHSITKILEGDYRSMTGKQTEVVTKARANFVLIGDLSKKSSLGNEDKIKYIYLDSGHCTMGFYLFASSNNMKGVVRAMVDVDPLLELLGLNKEDHLFTLSFSLGF